MPKSKLTVPGFRAAALKAGIRKAGDRRLDMALVVCDTVANAAAVFTRNKINGAPVQVSKKRLRKGKTRAVLMNAGIANTMTGKRGVEAATVTTGEVARALDISPDFVLPSSTGVIGVELPVDKMVKAAPRLVSKLAPGGFEEVSKAILTTDTVPKVVRTSFVVGGKRAVLLGLAKGSGMIAPNMATMLAFLFTNAAVETALLKSVLSDAARQTFNCVTVDGDSSTNDTVLIMAGGVLGNPPIAGSGKNAKVFSNAVQDVCAKLSEMIVKDGEGATRIAQVVVKGARNDADAVKAARTIAESPLVKTALHGADPNWGRIAAAAGRSGAKIDQNKLKIKIGGIACVSGGTPARGFDEKKAAAVMRKSKLTIEVDLGVGRGQARFLTCDFSAEYVRINAHYRT